MSLFLEKLDQWNPNEAILLVLDGAGWHRARKLRVPESISLLPLLPYSPELNPVEHIWDESSEKWFQNLVFSSLDTVEDRLVDGLVILERDHARVRTLTGFPMDS